MKKYITCSDVSQSVKFNLDQIRQLSVDVLPRMDYHKARDFMNTLVDFGFISQNIMDTLMNNEFSSDSPYYGHLETDDDAKMDPRYRYDY